MEVTTTLEIDSVVRLIAAVFCVGVCVMFIWLLFVSQQQMLTPMRRLMFVSKKLEVDTDTGS